ncbi:hypothetical protein [Streptomyces fructofermentans]|uniref:hypothetical protein n=1 Tax=Streptomyces fructofermentans TaxID=152141 RepID=UPI0037977B8E
MPDPGLLERITVRRAELDALENQLVDVWAERDELAVVDQCPATMHLVSGHGHL